VTKSVARLSVDGLSVRYKDFALLDITFKIAPGEIVAFIGGNGAGKSTTINSICGLVKKDKGTIKVGEIDNALHDKRFKKLIGLVPETGYFYDGLSVKRILNFASKFYENWNEDYCLAMCDRLSLQLDKAAGKLSKGNRMKLSFILANAFEPKFLILDEPTSGLDPKIRADVLKIIKSQAKQKNQGCLISSHNLSDLQSIATRFLLIKNGILVKDISKRQLEKDLGADDRNAIEAYILGLI